MSTRTKASLPQLPYRSARTGALSVFFIMALVIAGAFVTSGSGTPVDPNGPGGPPTLEPYYSADDYPKQKIVLPTGGQTQTDNNLQLKTFGVSNCAENSAMIFLIDTSGSMKFSGKMDNTKKALKYFTDNMGGKSVIGLYTFSKDVKEVVPINLYKEVKTDVAKAIDDLQPDGWTRTKDGMQMAYQNLKETISDKVYPGYKYNLILMTDGVPEVPPSEPRTCYVTAQDPNTAPALRCFAREQDPRVPENFPNEIKALDVSIFSVNIYSPSYPSDVVMFPYLETLLKDIASPPTTQHYFSSVNAGNLQAILDNISNAICYDNFTGKAKPL